MSLETLANELLFEIFQYLSPVQLLRSFRHLNKQFDDLLVTHFQTHHFDFRQTSKKEFEEICQNDFSSFVEHLTSLGLSDDDENPQQIHLFLSQSWIRNRFGNLRSISFDHLRSSEIVTKVLSECSQLIRLRLIACYFGSSQSTLSDFINTVWTSPRLKFCHLNIDAKHGVVLPLPKQISTSIKYLTIIGMSFSLNRLEQLYDKTPNLRSVTLDLHPAHGYAFPQEILLPLMNSMNLSLVAVGSEAIQSLLRIHPNLKHLKIETLFSEIDGHEWEKIISKNLPNLTSFQLKMRLTLVDEADRQEFFQSFLTPFWLNERRWFVQFHYNPDDVSRMVCLYTLPYSFTKLEMFFPLILQSTTNNNQIYSFDHVQHLGYRSNLIDPTINSNVRFSNLNSISVQLPIEQHFLSLLERITTLRHLEITRSRNLSNVDAQTQLQNILDRTGQLYSLKFQTWKDVLQNNARLTPMVLTSRHIRRIDLLGYSHHFTNDECEKLISSAFFSNCEVLSLLLAHHSAVLILTNGLPRLRSLIFRSNDDNLADFRSFYEGPFVQELRQSLPPTYSIARDARFVHFVRIWI